MKKLTFFLAVCILTSYDSFAQRCFSPVTYFATGVNPSCVTSADFNGDGKADLATAHPNSYDLSILIGDGLGGFAAASNIAVGATQRGITSADFNGDNKMDIAVTNDNINYVSILLGNGSGGFSPATIFAVGTWPNSIISADFNGDGIIDLATANRGSSNLSILVGNGSGGFGTATTFAMTSNPWNIIKADFNGDNKIDLATNDPNSNSVSVLLGNGIGGFSSPVSFALIGQSPTSLTSDDFNGDGDMDIATSQGGSNKISLLLGNGSGGFSTPVNLTTPGNTHYTITSGDVNEDGKIDLATVGANHVVVLLGNGSGGFSSDSMACVAPIFIINADITGDGKKDIVACTNSNSYMAVFVNKGFMVTLSSINPTCSHDLGFNSGNGSITATISGGISSYTTAWNTFPVQTSNSATNLAPGTYSITVHDNNTCSQTATATITGPPPISVTTTQTDVTCYGYTNGSATVSAAGGQPPYTYSWNTTPVQTTANATNLAAGNYAVTVTDALSCIAMPGGAATVDSPGPITIFSEESGSFPNTKCGGICNGVANVSVYGGTEPYSYLWDAGANNQTIQTAVNLCKGTFTLTVTDINGCTGANSATVDVSTVVDPNIFLTNLAAVDQVNVSPSFASYYTYNLPTSITPPPSNPRNFVDPGKKARFKVECRNQKTNGQSVVSGICKVRTNSPYITITDSSSILNNIAWNNSVWSADEFEIDINPTTPAGSNAYIDFIVQESGVDYRTTCVSIPITPLDYAPTTVLTIDDDSNPDSQGNNNDICEPVETIEFYPWLNSISTLNAEYVRGSFENLENLSFINIWNNVPGAGVNVTVYDETWWNWGFGLPQVINSSATDTKPEYDFVFDYNSTSSITDFKLYMVMAGGFKLFSGNALSLVQWTLPYTFNGTGTASIDAELEIQDYLNVYPNPTNGNVQLSIDNIKIQKVNIYNQMGALMYQSEKEITDLNLSRFPKGVYLIKVQSGDKVFNKKLILQ
jgi:hypothetical protein